MAGALRSDEHGSTSAFLHVSSMVRLFISTDLYHQFDLFVARKMYNFSSGGGGGEGGIVCLPFVVFVLCDFLLFVAVVAVVGGGGGICVCVCVCFCLFYVCLRLLFFIFVF